MTTLAHPLDTNQSARRATDQSATTVAERWFGTGRSGAGDAREAGVQATAAALDGRTAALVIVFCPVSIDLAAMLDGVRAESGDVPLIGCTGAAQYSDDAEVGPAVVVTALGGDVFRSSPAWRTTCRRASGLRASASPGRWRNSIANTRCCC